MSKNLQSPTKLTEFAPLQQEEKPQSVGQFISKFFKITRAEEAPPTDNGAGVQDPLPTWAKEPSEASDSPASSGYPVDVTEGRSLPNVLQRISTLLALRTNNLQDYADTELKQYWMPDSVSKECYECSEKFTTFRRRHHCRVCGQIFCSQCCNQQIPGKIFGCTAGCPSCALVYCQIFRFLLVIAFPQSIDKVPGESLCISRYGDKDKFLMSSELSEDMKNYIEYRVMGFVKKIRMKQGCLPSNFACQPDREKSPSSIAREAYLNKQRREIIEELLKQREIEENTARAGDLRVCTYCCKVVLSYLQSSNFGPNLSADLKILQENLQSKFGDSTLLPNDAFQNTSINTSESTDTLRRKISVGYQEEKFASGSSTSYLTSEEKCKALQNSTSLRSLFEEICKPTTGITFAPYKYRLRTYPECFLGSELVDWLICQQKAKTRIQAAALAQALLEGSYIESFTEPSIFVDGYVRYRKGNLFSSNFTQLSPNFEVPSQEEPSWVQQIPHESSNTDSDNEQMSSALTGLPMSHSYMLDLNVEASSVYLSRPPDSPYGLSQEGEVQPCEHEETTVVRPSEQRELAPESGWFNVSTLREENGEKEAYELLTETYEQHEQTLLKQLLTAKGLSHSWSDVLLPLIHDVVSIIRPDKNHDAIELDIRNYVQFKKLPGGAKKDTILVNGVVCSKHVAHKEMAIDIENPKILLLQCSIVYQRTEGRLMSLEPVLMQEHEYLRHVSARIVALEPDVVLVHKNVSRLAQDMLRKHNITLVHNVKQTVLDRLARCTQADIVTAVDAHIGRPKLGTCKRFYLRNFNTERGGMKTLMFFEGLPSHWLGGTILLRGAPKYELVRVKKVASFLLFTAYNWRLEKSFLMDEFALPPNSKMEFLDDSHENSPQFAKPKFSIEDIADEEIEKSSSQQPDTETTTEPDQEPDHSEEKSKPAAFTDPLQSNDHKKITVESINDNSDPLHSRNFDNNPSETFTVSELPFSNNFKKYLDDTILCISPYVIFPVPYLETDAGKKCKLRRFFFKDMYYSEQFEINTKNKWRNSDGERLLEMENNRKNSSSAPLHPFLTAKITNIDSNNIQNMLANFRACGGQYPKKEFLNIVDSKEEKPTIQENTEKTRMDVLDPMNHQKLAVLFCSFSHESNNAPAFCVNPWVVYMDFYGRNDIPIGCFLERYCFRPSYACPSKTCVTPMVKHIRRFVHNSGCVTISLNNFESEFSEENIVMWSWCTKCQGVSPVVPMSADTWSYSFAKYLELRFHGEIFNRRGQSPCQHSLHHDHYHYFGYRNYVASFKYSSINIWEISLPPALIEITYDSEALHAILVDEARVLSQKGHETFSIIQDKLSVIPGEELEGVGNVRQLLAKEQAQFKQKLEEMQLKLTSPTVESKEFDVKVVCQAHWRIQDNIIRTKMFLVELVDNWNMHLGEAVRSDKKKDKNLVPELESPAVEVLEFKPPVEISKEFFDSEKSENQEDSVSRRQSDSSSLTHVEDCGDGKKEQAKKSEKSVKNILDKLLPSSGQLIFIQNPFPPQEHYSLPQGTYGSIVVNESEVSSIIAFALNSFEYKKTFEELTNKKPNSTEQTPSPVTKRRNTSEKEKAEPDDKSSGLLGFLRTKDSKTDLNSPVSSTSGEFDRDSDQSGVTPEKQDDLKKNKNSHIEIQFQDSTCNFFCRIYLADKFANLRAAVLPIGEEAYVRSLSRSAQWKARGGKSGSNFAKTLDDRFILKDMSKTEVQLFLESSSNYFTYMQKCCATAQPTLLGKIVGIYQIIYKNSSNVTHRSHLLVMENLFYNRDVSQKFDLKGSMRNRMVVPDNQEGEIVLLDENLLKMTCDSPLYVLPHSKEVLLAAIQNDTEFLSTQSVMDYSLLVGLDTRNKELVLGIIDYIRTFTWDKRLETMVKRSGILGGQGKLPTIISPEEYQKRFIEAMHKYFLEVPDHYAGLGKGLEV